MSQKTIVMILMGIGVAIGAILPFLCGAGDVLGGMPILSGFVGGIVGIWLGAKVVKRIR